jgi:hypothetical protein
LAVEGEAVDWFDHSFWRFQLHESISCICSLSSNESKLDIRVKVRADVFERQFEFLDTGSLLDSERDQFRVRSLVEKLLDAFDLWVVQVAKEKHINFLANFGFFLNNSCRIVVQVFFKAFYVVASKLRFGHFNVHKRYNSRLQLIFGSFNNNNEFLAH